MEIETYPLQEAECEHFWQDFGQDFQTQFNRWAASNAPETGDDKCMKK